MEFKQLEAFVMVVVTPTERHYQVLLDGNCSFDELIKKPIILRENGSATKKTAERFLEAKNVDIKKLNVVALINDQKITIMSKKLHWIMWKMVKYYYINQKMKR